MRRFLDFDCGGNSALLVNNYDWIGRFGYVEFLRDVGKHFPVNVMLAKDSVRSRLERSDAGMSYTEFSYMLLQAYDFVHLQREFGCQLQAGGSDQWGNITAGIDLARRMFGVQLYGITCPLLTKSDGTKMGKTESGALWLSPERTSPYRFYQYWINLDDADVGRCLRFFTDLEQEEIRGVEAEHLSDPGRRTAQRRLAAELTRLVHGEEGLDDAAVCDGNPLRRRDRPHDRRPTRRHFRRRSQQRTVARAAGPSGADHCGGVVRGGPGEEQGRGAANHRPRRGLREQPPRRRRGRRPRPRRPRRRIDPRAPLWKEELRPAAVRRVKASP